MWIESIQDARGGKTAAGLRVVAIGCVLFRNGNSLRRLATPSRRDRTRACNDDKRCAPGSAGPLALQTPGVRIDGFV